MDFTTVLTTGGNGLSVQTYFDKGNITFNRIEIGSGINADPEESTALANKQIVGQFLGIERNEESAILKFTFDNKEVVEGFEFREYGIWATLTTALGEKIDCLYAYGYSNSGKGTEIPAFTDSKSYIKESLNVALKIGSPESVNVYLGEYEDYASKDILTKHLNNNENPHNVTAEQVGLGNVDNVSVDDSRPNFVESSEFANVKSGDTTSTLWGKVKKIFSKLHEHLLNDNNPHSVTWKQLYNKSAAPLPVELGGTGVITIEDFKHQLRENPVNYKSSVNFGSDIFNIYCDAFLKQNNIAFIFMTFQIKKALGQDVPYMICRLPAGIRPPTSIAVQGQTSQQGNNPSVTIQLNPDGNVMLYSFGYENLPPNTFYRFQAIFPTAE